ncbi:MAG: hypothetical protein RQ754_07005 [Desulfuromonadales bacterium]|nr:hypothetical protein [Desulfuromonadales bacterium]
MTYWLRMSDSSSRLSSGKNPVARLEWNGLPSTATSKTPPLDSISLTSAAGSRCFILAARLAARAR